MNHQPGLLANYNSLMDKHLAGYFSNTRIRRHLRRAGLISRSGRIISEKEYQLNAMRKDHHKYIRECLAQAIFRKVLEMERHHQGEIKRKFETSARKDRVQRVKVERSRKAAEDAPRLLFPHPPTGPRNRLGRRRFGSRGQLGQLATYPRPSTAPGSIQQPVRLQPLLSCVTDEPAPKAASRPKHFGFEKEHQYPSTGEKGVLKSLDYSAGISPYRLPIVNNFVVPIPSPPKSDKKIGTPRGRRFRPTTAPNGLEQMMKETVKFYRPQIQSNAYVTMIYLGKTVHLSYDLLDQREEIKIYQQHCGGENLCVFRAKVLEGETFQFISKRHYGFPFSLTFYLNGMQVDRLSTCCEYKHRKGTRLGGKHGYFGLVNVERSAPCYRCIIAMGLDKKPSPPKKKTAVADEEKKEDSEKKEEYSYKLPGSSSSGEESKYLRFTPASRQRKEFVGDAQEMRMEARRREIERALEDYEKRPRSAASYAYDEDFEVDEEKSYGKVNEEGRAGDQMKRMSKSPSDDEKDNLDHEKKRKKLSLKASRPSDSERDESDGYTESDLEEKKQGEGKAADWEMDAAVRKIQHFYRKRKHLQQTQAVKPDRKAARSLSSSSMPYSSENESDRETRKQGSKQEKTDRHSGYESETAKSQREKRPGTDMEEGPDMGGTPPKDARDVPRTSHKVREARRQDTSPDSEEGKVVGSVGKSVRDDREKDVLVHSDRSSLAETRSRGPSEDEDEGDGKSVKEKIAEAMEHDRLLSSGPEPSDSSTEDEEESIAKKDKHKGEKHKVPDGASLAKEPRVLESQKVAGQVEHARQMVGKERALDEEELADEEGPKEAALGEELLGKNVTGLKAKQAGNKERAFESVTSKGKEIHQLEGEEAEKETFIQAASEGDEEAEEAAEASGVLGTTALMGKKPMAKKAHREKADMEEADWTAGTTFAARSPLEKREKTQDEEEALGDDMESKEGKILKGGVKEKKYVKIQLEGGSLMEAEGMALGSTEQEEAPVSGARIHGGKGVTLGASSESEEIVQEISGVWGGETKKTSLEVKEKRRISRDTGSTQQKLETQVGERLSEAEAEGFVSAAEDEEMRGQSARIIQKADRAAVKPYSERRAGRKTHLEMRERKRISRDEGSAQEKLESEEGEPLLESEAEGDIFEAEEEEISGQEGRVIRKAERSAIKPRSERKAGRKTHLETKEGKRISRDEGSAQEKLETEEGEPLSESEAEGDIFEAEEEEEISGQEARVIQKAERSAVKPRPERKAGRKTHLETRERKKISRDEGSAHEKLESEEGELLSESEAEADIFGAGEEEEISAQEGRVIRKAERSAMKPRSERKAGRKTETRERKRISRDEGSAQEKLETEEGELLSESEAEGDIFEAEEEEISDQEGRVIQKADRSAVKPRSERKAGRKTHLEMRERKRISRDEGSAQEKLESEEGEPLLESEAEADIFEAEEEEISGQEGRVIRKADRSAVKPRSERKAGRKTHLEMRERKRISRDEGSAQEKLESEEGEPLLESEAEADIFEAEEEEISGQEAREIRKADRSAVKPRTERKAGRKTHLETRERKRISREEGSAQEKLESEEGEPLLESEAEADIFEAEEEEISGQEGRVIRKADRSAAKPPSERKAGRKTHLETRERKRISRDEGSAQEKLESEEGEPLLESEAEADIFEAEEEEEISGQEARVIRKAERSAMKPRSERKAGRKTHLETKERKRISRDKGSAQEKLESEEGEPLLESEAEGDIFEAEEEEEISAQEGRVIRKPERSAVKPRSERKVGRKTRLETKERKRVSRDESSAQEKLESEEGELLLESEAEEEIFEAAEEEMSGQEARVIRKAKGSAIKPRSERRAGRKTHLETREKKRISRDEGSAEEKLESEEGELLSESEAEGDIFEAEEEEEISGQEARVIRKAERSSVKSRSERKAGRKTHLEMKERKRISRDEGSAEEKLESEEGELLSESEAEEEIFEAAEEEISGQEARVIRKAKGSAIKPRSERRAGRKTHLETRERKRISRDEGSAQEKLESEEDEFLSESEAEGIISGAEEEEISAQEARVIRKAERSAVKPRSERKAGRKTHLEMKERKRISRDEGSAGQKLELEVGEPLSESETEGVISAAEYEDMIAKEPTVIRKRERSGVKPHSERSAGRRSTLRSIVASAEGAVEEEDLIDEEGEEVEEVEEGMTDEMLVSGVIAPKGKQRSGRRKTEAEGGMDFEEAKAERKVAIRRRTEAKISGEERERGSQSVAHEKKMAHGITITAQPRVAGVTEAIHLSEPSMQKAALAEGEVDRKVSFQDEVEKTSKRTVAGKMSPVLGIQVEDARDVAEKEKEASYPEEPMRMLRGVEEALLAGMQKLIEQVSFVSEEVDEEKGEPEEREVDVSVEEAQMMSHKEEAGRKEFFAAAVKRKTWRTQREEALEAGTEEPVEEKYRHVQRRTGEEESPAGNIPEKEIVPVRAHQPERELPVNFTLQMISLESTQTFD